MSKINIESTRSKLQNFQFKQIFIEELGWSNPENSFPVNEQVKELIFTRTAIAELSGAVVFEIQVPEGNIPAKNERLQIAKYIQTLNFENVTIFIDKDRTKSIWHWLKVQEKKHIPREHAYLKGQPGDLFISKLSSLVFDISEFDSEGNVSIVEVAERLKKALDIEVVTKKFFKDYQKEFLEFVVYIQGISDDRDRKWYASVILNRLMFIYFLQKKHFLDNGDTNYLSNKLNFIKSTYKTPDENKFFSLFLDKLFFEGFALPTTNRSDETNKLIGNIKYLNGGLFLKHKLELKYPEITISDKAFENLFNLFGSYSWSLNDSPGGDDNEINPDVLGYIFEKYINQKAFGAYYTRTEITEYLCEQTIHKLLLDELNEVQLPSMTFKGKTETHSRFYYETIEEALFNIDAEGIKKLIYNKDSILQNLSLLDPACGSGAFLIAALKKLIDIYSAVIGKIDFIGNKELKDWKQNILKDHPNIDYYIKKQIITNNLYGVDIMEEAVEIAKLRLFLALVASAHTVDDLEPLPNIDFNIMPGNSLIGMLRVNEKEFDNNWGSRNLFSKSYSTLLNEKQIAIRNYQHAEENNILDRGQLLKLRQIVDEKRNEAMPILNDMLLDEFGKLKIKYEQVTWDTEKNIAEKSLKRVLNITDIEALHPFHWGYEFSKVFSEKGGFDAIITNPPWEVYKPEAKEFFAAHSDKITKNKMVLKDFEIELSILLQNKELKELWTDFLSQYPHVSEYFKKSKQFINQISIIDGKKAAANNNLYKLFTEQCYNLLKNKGLAGLVIPSGIYNDIGAKQLRELLFDKTEITGLFCFENRKEIFEGVHRSFKFVVLSFEKGFKSNNFPASFMRHDVEELLFFPANDSVNISVDLVKKLSPDSFLINEFKNKSSIEIFNKIYSFSLFNTWLNGEPIEISREFNAADDDFRFNTLGNGIRIYEGKLIWHFDAYFSEPQKYITEENLRETHFFEKGDWKQYRIAIRRVAASTNERALVSAILPKNVITIHSVFANVKPVIDETTSLYIVSFLNSFILDYVVRNQATTNITKFIINNLPIPRLNSTDKWFRPIVERATKLICTTTEFADLWNEVMLTTWSSESGVTNETERNKLRAELDGIIANIYELTEEEFAYILSTFPLVKDTQKELTLEEFRKVREEIGNETEESQIWVSKIAQKENKEIELKSTLRFCLKEKKEKREIEHSALKSIAAFLNSEGGELFIGVDDNGAILGLENDYSTFKGQDKKDKFLTYFDTIFETAFGNQYQKCISMQFPVIKGKTICVVKVEKSSDEVWLNDKYSAKG
ncbi:MAG: putative DNA binding domain-containing protein, partial [Bacteroidales bacterium]|nr:putative DNA binding domain-containing protein [Bacteroidales bacterium]